MERSPVRFAALLAIAGLIGLVSAAIDGSSPAMPLVLIGLGGFLILLPRVTVARVCRTNALIREGFNGSS
jgi:hypothetical protein